MKRFILLLLGLVSIGNFIFMYWLNPLNLISTLSVGAWLSLPYATLALLIRYIVKNKTDIIPILFVVAAITIFAIREIINSVFINPDPQGALVFLFVPIYQFAIIALAVVILMVIKLTRKKTI
ncbi:MAG: hypothetical protein R3D71_02930 [Rickettsiales bacterium]